jgi:hypothetical protein
VEVVLGGILPAILLMVKRIRASREGLITSAILVLAGVLSQRMSLSLFAMQRPQRVVYMPSMLEVIIAIAIPAAAGLIYFLFVENLAVFDEFPTVHVNDPYAAPRLDPVTGFKVENRWRTHVLRRSGLVVFAIALLIAALPKQIVTGQPQAETQVNAAVGWEVLYIDGNQAGYVVSFAHAEHQERMIEQYGNTQEACQVCHHMDKPGDQVNACSECHKDYYQAVSIFDHNLHQRVLGNNASCTECHLLEHTSSSAKPCQACHEGMFPVDGKLVINRQAPGYRDALHNACQGCHQEQALIGLDSSLGACVACHGDVPQNMGTVLVR